MPHVPSPKQQETQLLIPRKLGQLTWAGGQASLLCYHWGLRFRNRLAWYSTVSNFSTREHHWPRVKIWSQDGVGVTVAGRKRKRRTVATVL